MQKQKERRNQNRQKRGFRTNTYNSGRRCVASTRIENGAERIIRRNVGREGRVMNRLRENEKNPGLIVRLEEGGERDKRLQGTD